MEQYGNQYKDYWNGRYKDNEFTYGKIPNLFFKQQLDKLSPGTILLPAEGEGRNAVYAAINDWKTTCLDLSEEGKRKALELAIENNTHVDYIVGDLEELDFEPEAFDAIALIYAHFLPHNKVDLLKKLDSFLKPGGSIIFEAFSKTHEHFFKLNPKAGGGMPVEMLYQKSELEAVFRDYNIHLFIETEVDLNEGNGHNGKGAVIRFIGQKT